MSGLITYKGLPAPVVCHFLTREQWRSLYSEGTEFYIGRIEMVANTYVDSPFHRYPEGNDLAELPLFSLANLEGVVVRATEACATGEARFDGLDVCGKP